jgi:hypothetical protein
MGKPSPALETLAAGALVLMNGGECQVTGSVCSLLLLIDLFVEKTAGHHVRVVTSNDRVPLMQVMIVNF